MNGTTDTKGFWVWVVLACLIVGILVNILRSGATFSSRKQHMLPLSTYAEIAAIVSAMVDVYKTGRDAFQEFYATRAASPDIENQAEILRQAMSTYSDAEVKAIINRLESCRQRFIAEGSGPQRKTCLCSVLTDVKDGNGGEMPGGFPDWEQMFDTLQCDAVPR